MMMMKNYHENYDDDGNDDDDVEVDWTGPVEMCNGACSSKPGVSQRPTNQPTNQPVSLPSTSNQFLPHRATVINPQDSDDNHENSHGVSHTHTTSNQFVPH